MRVSECVFHTGAAADRTPALPEAREILDELFTHSDGISALFLQEAAQAGIVLPEPPVRVVTISPGPGSNAFSMASAEQFAGEMKDAVSKRISQDGVFFYIRSGLQGIVSIHETEELQQLYSTLQALVEDYPQASRPHAAISNLCETLTQISRGCDETHEAHLFERFLASPIDVIVQPADYFLYGGDAPGEDDDAFFGEISQKICNAMTVGDRQRMHRALDRALDYMVGRFPRVSGVHMRAIHFCKPLEMSLVGADLIDRLFVQQFRLVQKVIETDGETSLRETFHQQMDQIWDYSVQRRQLRHGVLMRRVAEYIDRNLSDSMLSIATIAESFHLSETKLSSLFRSYYQESIPNFIHQRRVDLLKRLLISSDRPVRELALDAGYISLATMNRAFYRLEGLYPGQYRREHRRTP